MSNNNSAETIYSGIIAYFREVSSLNLYWDIEDVNQNSSTLKYM